MKPFFLLIIFILTITTGCIDKKNDYNGEPGITGYVIKKDGQRILVVSQEAKDFSLSGGEKNFYDAVWLKEPPIDVMVGEKVRVWFGNEEIESSYPAQTSVGKIEIIPSSTPKGATLSESEALKSVLEQNETPNEILTVKSISLDADKNEWLVVLKNTVDYKEYTIRLEDK